MTIDEHRRVVEIVVEQANGRVPSSPARRATTRRRRSRCRKRCATPGATHLLHTSPMYNKPPQRGIVAHYRAIAEAVDLPIVVYNVPGRTGSNIEAKTTLELARIPGIVAVKEASGQLSQIADIIRGRGSEFSVLSGDDELTLPVMALGGDGIVSVVSNATPRLMSRAVRPDARGRLSPARARSTCTLLPWMRAAFVESNPMPVKAALAMMGQIEERAAAAARAAGRHARRRGARRRCRPPERCVVTRPSRRCSERHRRRSRATPAGAALPTRRRATSSTSCSTRSSAATFARPQRATTDAWRAVRVGEARHPARLSRRAISTVAYDGDALVVRRQGHVSDPRASTSSDERSHRARRFVDPPRRLSSRRASCACRRCTSTSARTSTRARWSIRTRWSARARRSASACT